MSDQASIDEIKKSLGDLLVFRIVRADIPGVFDLLCNIHRLIGDNMTEAKKLKFLQQMIVNYDKDVVTKHQLRSQHMREMAFVGYAIEQLEQKNLLPKSSDAVSPCEALNCLIPAEHQPLWVSAGR